MKRRILLQLFRSGALAALHRQRNRHTLTVVIYHRVLPFNASLPVGSWPPWTVTPDFFEQCLLFYLDHYNVVSLKQVVQAAEGGEPLPHRALLVTFDDGWRDNCSVAAPILQRYSIPAALFATARGGDGSEHWQEPVIRAWLQRRLRSYHWEQLSQAAGGRPGAHWNSIADLHRLLIALESFSSEGRQELLARFGVPPPEPGCMMTAAQLREFADGGREVGAHGVSHHPMDLLPDPEAELRSAKDLLESTLRGIQPAVTALSWPHGRYTGQLTRLAFHLGYRCILTSDPVLNRLSRGRPSRVLGRCESGMSGYADAQGRLLPERMARLLFFLRRSWIHTGQ